MQIKPLAYDDAKKWAEEALDGDEWIKEFGEPQEDMDRVQIQISMTVGAVNIVKRAAQKRDKSVSETIEMLMREHLS